MKLGSTSFWISINKNKELWTNLYGQTEQITQRDQIMVVTGLMKLFKKRTISIDTKMSALATFFQTTNNVNTESKQVVDNVVVTNTIQSLINFFSEFEFEPNFRFINSFAYACNASYNESIKYIGNYFELIDSVYVASIIEKMKSDEFKKIYDTLSTFQPTHKVNKRFKLYYGSQGTGKTTAAVKESSGRCMVCHSAMLPSDLLEDFKFDNGQATFSPSALQEAMVKGMTIVLDEINLLPFESLRFLQSILDGKQEFMYKGKTVVIKEGFQIIGTMNLHVNGCTYSLPEPLVDRASELKKFNLTAEMLLGAII